MATGRVIVDTDEEEDGASSCADSPESIMVIGQPDGSEENDVATPSTGSFSIDPTLFKAVYKKHFGMTPLQSDELRNSYQSPTDLNSVPDQTTSSSETSDRRLKRSRTMDTSSLASISEHNESDRKAKRAKSMKDIEDLTQVTTPNRSKYLTGKDPWEFPDSTISETPKSTEMTTVIKTHGRLRRSHTTIDGVGENSVHKSRTLVAQEGLEDNQNPSHVSKSPIDSKLTPSTTKLKRIRRAVSARVIESESDISTVECSIQKGLLAIASQDVPRLKSTEPPIVQVECSASEMYRPRASPSIVQTSEIATNSIVIIPATLTEEQKLQYNVINLTSSDKIQHSLSGKPDCIDTNSKCLAGEDTISVVTQESAAQSQIGRTPTSAILLSSSPHTPSASLRMKRAQSEIGVRECTPPAIIESSSKITKRRGRRKTTALEEVLKQGASVDELSLLPTAGAVSPKIAAATKDKKRATDEVSQQGTAADLSRDELQEEEPHKLRSSLGRNAATKRDIDVSNQRHQNEALEDGRDVRRGLAVLETLAEIDVLPTMPIAPNQPKKRGRKKTSEMTASKTKERPQAPNPESFHSAPLTKPPTALREADSNIQASLLAKSSAPEMETNPTKMLANPTATHITSASASASATSKSDSSNSILGAPPQTPSKDRDDATQMGTEQHSPLQNGRVPYRVGLSKRRRIAPLLKIIRK